MLPQTHFLFCIFFELAGEFVCLKLMMDKQNVLVHLKEAVTPLLLLIQCYCVKHGLSQNSLCSLIHCFLFSGTPHDEDSQEDVWHALKFRWVEEEKNRQSEKKKKETKTSKRVRDSRDYLTTFGDNKRIIMIMYYVSMDV